MKKLLLIMVCLLSLTAIAQTPPNIIDAYLIGSPTKTVVANYSKGIVKPRDLDFHPTRDELWVVLMETEATGGKTALISKPGKTGQSVLIQKDGNAWHFMSLPTGIAFSSNGNFSTSPGVFDANHNGGAPFTGPSLWSSDPLIYAQYPGAGLNGSHLDMLHESPYSMGICSDTNNIFWVNDGYHNTVVRYDFKGDHGPGGAYHSDGIIRRYTGLGLVEDSLYFIPSHMILDKATGWLYIADTGNNRIVRLNTKTGTKAGNLSPYEAPMAEYSYYTGFSSNTYVNTGLAQPSGIDLVGNRLIVSDYATGEIIIYNKTGTTGVELGRIQTNASGIMGIKIGPDGKIWYVDANNNEVVRLNPASATDISETVIDNIQIYPNPASEDYITLSNLNQTNTIVKIYNTMGQLALETTVNVNESQINIASLKQGSYIVQLMDKKSTDITIKKLIVIK